MLRFVIFLTLTILSLSAFSTHVEQQISAPLTAYEYWTKERMQSATAMPMGLLDKRKELSKTIERHERIKKLDEPETYIPGTRPKGAYKKTKIVASGRSARAPSGKRKTKVSDTVISDICGIESSCTDFLPEMFHEQYPNSAIGKVFFTLLGFNFFCSASAVTSITTDNPGNENMVLTAGHCLSDGAGHFATSFVFAPAYYEGDTPFGLWPATTLYTTTEWHSGFGLARARDVGFAIMSPNGNGQNLHDVVGSLGIKFNKKRSFGKKISAHGYGVSIWGGEKPVVSLSPIIDFDLDTTPNPIAINSEHTGGASGGPWLLRYIPDLAQYDERHFGILERKSNTIVGINSYLINGTTLVFSPVLDSEIFKLWQFVANQ